MKYVLFLIISIMSFIPLSFSVFGQGAPFPCVGNCAIFDTRFKGVEIVVKEEYQEKIKELEMRIEKLEAKQTRKRKRR